MNGIKGKPDVQSFISGGDAPNPHKKTPTTKPEKRAKMVQLPADLLSDLKRFAIAQAAKRGTHVTETAVIEAALKQYIY